MIHTDKVIVVEGKYDKITLSNIVDGVIIVTDGFRIFKDADKRKLISRLAKEKGLIVLTDSDSAGRLIRSHLKNICGDSEIINVYIPKMYGKEKRKVKPGKEGILGVEGMNEDIILSAFERAGISAEKSSEKEAKITKQDLFFMELSGKQNSAYSRKSLSEYLDIPSGMSSSAFLDAVNSLYSKEEFERWVLLWRQEADKK